MTLVKINESAFYLHLGYAEVLQDTRLTFEACFIYQDLANLPNYYLITKDHLHQAPRIVTREQLSESIQQIKDHYNPPEIKVTITGSSGSGKSSVAAAIMEALTKYDLSTTWESMDEDQVSVTSIYPVKLKAMKERGATIRIIDNNEK